MKAHGKAIGWILAGAIAGVQPWLANMRDTSATTVNATLTRIEAKVDAAQRDNEMRLRRLERAVARLEYDRGSRR